MPVHSLPDHVRRFILASIPSVPYLEAVLLLRAEPGTPWDARGVAQRLYLRPQVVREMLAQLVEAGVARLDPRREGCVHYQPATPELAAMLDQLAIAYSADLLGVTELIHSSVEKRALQFADAFRWRKEP